MSFESNNIIKFPNPQSHSQANAGSEPKINQVPNSLTKGKLKKRFYAFCTDLFFIGIIQKALVLSYMVFVNDSFFKAPARVKEVLVDNLYQMRLQTLVFTFFSYFLISLYLGHGKTIGKTIFNLRVVSHEGDPYELSFMESFMRTMGYTTCYVAYSILFALVFLRKDERGIPDLFSQTEVLTDEEFEALQHKEEELQGSLTEENDQLDLFAS